MSDQSDRDAARNQIVRQAQTTAEPSLDEAEIESILDRHKRAQRWTVNKALSFGDIVLPTVNNGHRYLVTDDGMTGSIEPTWPTSTDGSVTSGTVVLAEAGLAFSNIYNIRAAIEEAWALKAGKAAELHEDDAGLISDHCEERVKAYQTPMVA